MVRTKAAMWRSGIGLDPVGQDVAVVFQEGGRIGRDATLVLSV
jgi:hypothetical protein